MCRNRASDRPLEKRDPRILVGEAYYFSEINPKPNQKRIK